MGEFKLQAAVTNFAISS